MHLQSCSGFGRSTPQGRHDRWRRTTAPYPRVPWPQPSSPTDRDDADPQPASPGGSQPDETLDDEITEALEGRR